MMDRGARLPQDKFDTLIQYFGQEFWPADRAPAAGPTPAAAPSSDTPPTTTRAAPKPVELPEGDGKAIATEFCQDCHKLTKPDESAKGPRRLARHGAVNVGSRRAASTRQGRYSVAYLAKNFGPQG